ncbi:MAG: methylmalonyl-CoA epimerase [Chloroflexi bacterium]|nr:MAG: methylmalonyl-CoA epimerase [Chloroflexota bacterium]TMC32927.1 MAG: methylmalonyl-CoA epimerase [Chloroflexota bacterium]TMC56202.1 MAG: methylmalonyl-CoA epimerase [Chloroflexota bacterium]TME42691.1 MAG: methylmalonyl-CoA epimerase [Chloroflexota bacterium]
MSTIESGPLHHIGVVVPSLTEAIPFYRDTLGYTIGRQHFVADQRVRVVFATRGQSRVELLEPTDSSSGIARFLADRGRATMHHLCFEVDDLAAALERLVASGVELVDRAPRRGIDGLVAFLHPRASGGVLVELLQRSNA